MLNSLSVFHIVSNCLELKAEERTPHTRNWNIQADGYLSQRLASSAQFGDSIYIDNRARTTNALTHCPCMCHPSSNSLRNQIPFELSNRANNVKEKLPRRGGGINTFGHADEIDPQCTELIQTLN
jgi:hypothetical protein